ncbi:MAG: hypothetical protein WC752_03320 [Patescibacteria group bacterium]|jgi:hypothetical protein
MMTLLALLTLNAFADEPVIDRIIIRSFPTEAAPIDPCTDPCAKPEPVVKYVDTGTNDHDQAIAESDNAADVAIAESADGRDIAIATVESTTTLGLATEETKQQAALSPTIEDVARAAAAGGAPLYINMETGIISTGRPMYTSEIVATQEGNPADPKTSLTYATGRKVTSSQLRGLQPLDIRHNGHLDWAPAIAATVVGFAAGFIAGGDYQHINDGQTDTLYANYGLRSVLAGAGVGAATGGLALFTF